MSRNLPLESKPAGRVFSTHLESECFRSLKVSQVTPR